MIQKAKVYVKNPSETPTGISTQRGDRGGLYYESNSNKEIKSKISVENKRKFLKPSRNPKIHYDAEQTQTMGLDIYIGRDLPKGSKEIFLDHELLHITFYDYEDEYTKNKIKDLGNIYTIKDHPMYLRYSDREKASEDFVYSAQQWIRDKPFDYDIRNGNITSEQSQSRLDFFNNKYININKSKVYVKNPSEAPQGVKLERGKRGGQYYEAPKMSYEDLENLQDDRTQEEIAQDEIKVKEPEKIQILSKDSREFLNVVEGEDILYYLEPDIEHTNNLIKTNKVEIPNDVTIKILPCSMKNMFAFILPSNTNIIHLTTSTDDELNQFIRILKFELMSEGYDNDELKGLTADNKRIGALIHEIGHTKVRKVIPKDADVEKTEFKLFSSYVKYLHSNYGIPISVIVEHLDEILAEDYRQMVGGSQSDIPNRYLFHLDSKSSENYKYKEGRLDILRKMGVF